MDDLRTILDEIQLSALRGSYDPGAMVRANIDAIAQAAPALDAWNRQIADTFYGDSSALKPADRERCLIALLTQMGAELPLSVHIYWGLMEGLSLDEICQVIGLAGCYGGLPRCVQGLLVLQRVAGLLRKLADAEDKGPRTVLSKLVGEVGSRS